MAGPTRGSEPSQYPEEKKAIAIPKVAASEIGTAQTRLSARMTGGCRAHNSRVTNLRDSRTDLERPAKECDSHVGEISQTRSGYLSTAGHEKPCGKLRRPFRKAKYSLATDSEPVPRGKGEKNPCEGSEIVPETVCLQAVGGLCHPPGRVIRSVVECLTACLLHNEPAS